MISDKVEMRELVTLGGNGVLLHGTFHKPADQTNSAGGSYRHLGVMFLNALSSPRSLIGDSGVYWATSFAARGFPSFRFDLPGLGDSYGEIPNDLIRFTNEGGFAEVASSKAKELVHSRGLSGLLMFGHCAGATTAIYAAAGCRDCKGLILMDPYFNLPKAITSTLNPKLVLWARRSRLGAVIRATYDRVREVPGTFRKNILPPNANFNLISRLKQVVANGVPILILMAHQPAAAGGSAIRAGNFDYLAYILSLATRSNQFSVKQIQDTDHSFSNRSGRTAVWRHTEAWLSENFPEPNPAAPLAQNQGPQVQERNSVSLGIPAPASLLPGK